LERRFSRLDVSCLRPLSRQIAALTEFWLEHFFDLLGSGWVQVKHGMQCRGVEGYRYNSGPLVCADNEGRWLEGRINAANLAESTRIWQLVDEDYVPVDWHLDFKSGYRWSEQTWHGHVRWGHQPGIDIKVPWELARMQHLPQLAEAYALAMAGEQGFRSAETYIREFRSQVLDFIATNPPRFGVNWRCTMDVAIRVVNWLVAYDLFRSWGAAFDVPFETVFARSVCEHGLHIRQHLERNGDRRGNHYLADIGGLLFCAAYLPSSPTVDAWLIWALQELVAEVAFQFHGEGTNFEGSTSYHRLSAEIVVFATSLVLGLPSTRQAILTGGSSQRFRFPSCYWERLEKMAEFTMHVTKPTGRVHQAGDNDSGRFLKLQLTMNELPVAAAKRQCGQLATYDALPDEASSWIEEHLDHRSLVAAIAGLIPRADFVHFSGPNRFETAIVRGLSGLAAVDSCGVAEPPAVVTHAEASPACSALLLQLASDPQVKRYPYEIHMPGGDLREEVACCAYPAFGLYIFRSSRLYLAVRCGQLARGNTGGHTHYDQLAVELTVDGEDLIADPGTYLYTPCTNLRNAYRSVTAHFTPQAETDRKYGRSMEGLFQVTDLARAECLLFAPYHFLGRHFGFGPPVYRLVEIVSETIRIVDYAAEGLTLTPLPPVAFGKPFAPVPFSDGYGMQVT
jgi:hypothetical protein